MFDKQKSSKQGSPQIKESIAMQEDPAMSAKTKAPAPGSAVIGPGIEISGDVTASSDLTISGTVKGSVVQSSHNVEVSESALVTARIQAKLIKVAGEVRGDISASEKVLISKSGRVAGNIAAPRVQLEDGANFKGSIDMDPGEIAGPEVPSAKSKDSGASAPGTAARTPPRTVASSAGSALAGDSGKKEPSMTLKSG
jgi:cytoskeletal protein CcmA (bactofilin family)